MSINDYHNSFSNYYLKIKIKMLVSFILIILSLCLVSSKFFFYDYYLNKGLVNNDKSISLLVNIEDLDIVTGNDKLKIKNMISAYKIKEIKPSILSNNGVYQKEVVITCNKCSSIPNNLIDIKIEKEKLSFFQLVKKIFGGFGEKVK